MRYELTDFEWAAIATRYDKLAANYLAFVKLEPSASGYAPMSPRPNLMRSAPLNP
jgi:hypothetical protein